MHLCQLKWNKIHETILFIPCGVINGVLVPNLQFLLLVIISVFIKLNLMQVGLRHSFQNMILFSDYMDILEYLLPSKIEQFPLEIYSILVDKQVFVDSCLVKLDHNFW